MREADIKRAIYDRLQIYENQGRIPWFERLNSGIAFVKRGGTYYAIKLCRKGTPDFVVVFDAIFFEVKSDKGKSSDEQIEFQKTMEGKEIRCYTVRSVEEVMEVLDVQTKI